MTSRKQNEFLRRAFFGKEGLSVNGYIYRAYRDMNRTLRFNNINKKKREGLHDEGRKKIFKALGGLAKSMGIPSNERFNKWHDTLCLNLIKTYQYRKNSKKSLMTYGQAQKWVNMSMKYCWMFGVDEEFNGLEKWFPFAHIPVDSIILKMAKKYMIECPQKVWSKMNPEEYSALQSKLRKKAKDERKTPLELEHKWWMDGNYG